jgi:hypothetical protein
VLHLIVARSLPCRKQRIAASLGAIKPDRRQMAGRRDNPAAGTVIGTVFHKSKPLGAVFPASN